ncbi:MAG: hypothetical protein WDN06_02425 [Asticcacaulis sp.]
MAQASSSSLSATPVTPTPQLPKGVTIVNFWLTPSIVSSILFASAFLIALFILRQPLLETIKAATGKEISTPKAETSLTVLGLVVAALPTLSDAAPEQNISSPLLPPFWSRFHPYLCDLTDLPLA